MVRLRPYRSLGGGGFAPPDWAEIEAFARATGEITEEWEKVLMSQMCTAYLRGYVEGTDVLSIPPVEREDPDG